MGPVTDVALHILPLILLLLVFKKMKVCSSVISLVTNRETPSQMFVLQEIFWLSTSPHASLHLLNYCFSMKHHPKSEKCYAIK